MESSKALSSPSCCSRFFCYEGIRFTWKWDTIIFHTQKRRIDIVIHPLAFTDYPVWTVDVVLLFVYLLFLILFSCFCGSAGWWSRGHKRVWLRTMSHMQRTRRTQSWARWYQNICASSKQWLQIKIVPELSILLMTLTIHRSFHSFSHFAPDPRKVDTSAADVDTWLQMHADGWGLLLGSFLVQMVVCA